jgi:general secretion pathway protein M
MSVSAKPGSALVAWWRQALAARERRLVLVAAAVIGVYLLFTLALRPALATLQSAPDDLERLQAQLQSMQRLAAEVKDLRGAPPINTAQATVALRLASERLGDKARLSIQGDRAVLTLTNAGTGQIKGWLAEVRSGARARPVEANLSRSGSGYSGTISVAMGSGT